MNLKALAFLIALVIMIDPMDTAAEGPQLELGGDILGKVFLEDQVKACSLPWLPWALREGTELWPQTKWDGQL